MLSPLCARASVLAALVLALPGQTDRFRELFAKHFADLASPERGRDASRTLAMLGERVVPLLRERLHSDHRGEQNYDSLLGAIVVLARIGKPAMAAWPELLDVLNSEGPELREQTIWAMSQLVVHAKREHCEPVRARLEALFRVRSYVFNANACHLHLQLMLAAEWGDDDTVRAEVLRAVLTRAHLNSQVFFEAACDFATATPPSDPRERKEIRAHVEELLADQLQRPAMADDVPVSPFFRAGAWHLAAAWLAFGGDRLDALTARAMLGHWDADRRLEAVAFCAEHGAAMPFRERADLCSVLWDRDPDVALAAAKALAGLRTDGLVGLAPLRRRASDEGPEDLRTVCRESADAIVAAFAGDGDEVLVRAFDQLLRGEPATGRFDDTSRRLHEAMHGVLWSKAPTATAVLDAMLEHGLDPASAARLAMRAACMPDVELARAAFRWLAHHQAAYLRAEPDGIARLARMLPLYVAEAAHPAGVECLAWLGTKRVPSALFVDSELATITNPRRIVRVLVTAIADAPTALKNAGGTLHSFAALDDQWLDELDFDTREGSWSVRASLFEEIRLLSVVAMAAGGMELPALDAADAERVRRECGVEPEKLVEWLRTKRDTNALKPWLAEVEERAQRKIGVRPEEWPAKW